MSQNISHIHDKAKSLGNTCYHNDHSDLQNLTPLSTCSCCSHESTSSHHTKALVWYKGTDFYEIIVGSIFFISAQLLGTYNSTLELILLIISYIILGRHVLSHAMRNIIKGHIFDENFLMSIAAIGAFIIGQYPEAAGVMLFFRIGELFEEQASNKSQQEIIAAIDMRPETVLKIFDEKTTEIPAKLAEVGDILLIRPGDRVPLDGIIISGSSELDTSPLTGESLPRTVKTGDNILSGCINKTSAIKMQVEKVLAQSMVSRILASVQDASANKPTIERFISRFAKYYTPFVVIAAILVAIIPSLITGQWEKYIYAALTFLVISCPCALVLSVPLAFFSGIGRASRYGILFKGGAAIEALSKVKAAALDKTGTLTTGNFAIQEIKPADGFSQNNLLYFCASAEQASSHPLALSIIKSAQEENITLAAAAQINELSGKGIECIIDNKKITVGNINLMQENNIHIPFVETVTTVYTAIDGIYAGSILLTDELKANARATIDRLHKYNISTAILTGDAEKNTMLIAKKLGIKNIFAKLLPTEKLAALQKIRQTDGDVMFVGDGINDAPVLANANVGCAMGSGADAAIEAADVVFMTSKIEAVADALQIAYTTNNIAIQNIVMALGIKFAVMLLGVTGYASLWSAVFADTGVAMLCVLNSMRILYMKK